MIFASKRRQPRLTQIITLEENSTGHDWVVGDIHGQYELLRSTMQAAGFNPETDRLLSVGDLIDRGPDSPACLSLLDQPWFHACLGNHEWLFIQAYRDGNTSAREVLLANGGEWSESLSESECRHWAERLCNQLVLGIEVPAKGHRFGITHNDVYQLDWDLMKAESSLSVIDRCVWSRARFHLACSHPESLQPIRGIDWVLSGHNPCEKPILAENQVYIDTYWLGHELTLLNLQALGNQLAELTASEC